MEIGGEVWVVCEGMFIDYVGFDEDLGVVVDYVDWFVLFEEGLG